MSISISIKSKSIFYLIKSENEIREKREQYLNDNIESKYGLKINEMPSDRMGASIE